MLYHSEDNNLHINDFLTILKFYQMLIVIFIYFRLLV